MRLPEEVLMLKGESFALGGFDESIHSNISEPELWFLSTGLCIAVCVEGKWCNADHYPEESIKHRKRQVAGMDSWAKAKEALQLLSDGDAKATKQKVQR